MNILWDWKIILLIAGTAQPVPGNKGMELPSKVACIRAEAQVQTNASHVDARCVKKSTGEVYDFFPNPG